MNNQNEKEIIEAANVQSLTQLVLDLQTRVEKNERTILELMEINIHTHQRLLFIIVAMFIFCLVFYFNSLKGF